MLLQCLQISYLHSVFTMYLHIYIMRVPTYYDIKIGFSSLQRQDIYILLYACTSIY